MKIRINSVDYEILDNVSETNVLNTTLDTMSLTIAPINHQLDIECNDEVVVDISRKNDTVSEKKYFIIDNFKENIVCFNPLKYTYDLTLKSMIAKTQLITLPNIATTQPIEDDLKLSCFDRLNQFNEVYANDFTFSERLKQRLRSEICPEYSWNKPTYFEVLTTFLAKFKSVPTINQYSVIDYKDLKSTNIPVNEDYLIEAHTQMVSSNYASNLDLEITNGISKDSSVIERNVNVRALNGILTTSNAKILTNFSIYELKKMLLKNEIHYSFSAKSTPSSEIESYSKVITDLDLSKYILTKELYDLLEPTQYYSDDLKYKQNHFYFTKNEIGGFEYRQDGIVWDGPSALECVVNLALRDYEIDNFYEIVNIGVDINTLPAIRSLVFDVEYNTNDSVRFKAFKEKAPRNEASLFDGQTDAFVDIDELAKQKQDVVNSMANKEYVIYGRYSKYEQLENLGNVFKDKYIIYQRNINYKDNEIIATYLASENYVAQNMSAILNQEKRYHQIADASSSFLRKDNIEEHLHFSSLNNYRNFQLVNYLMKQVEEAKQHLLRTTFKNGTYSSLFVLPSQNIKIGNSILSTLKFKDNYAVGIKIANTGATGGYAEDYVSYVDDLGEFKSIEIYFGAYQNYRNELLNNYGYSETQLNRLQPQIPKPSDINLNDFMLFKSSKTLYKDNREITQFGIQFMFEDFKDVREYLIFDEFVKKSPLINKDNYSYKIYGSEEITTKLKDNKQTLLNDATLTINNNQVSINISAYTSLNLRSLIICDNNNKELFAINDYEEYLTKYNTINCYLVNN